jgi:4-alpha-glucanotransferase
MKHLREKKKPGKAVFAMAFHACQPAFNFESEFEKAYTQAYEPFVDVLRRFPGVKGTFHFSGNLLEWLEKKRPGYISKLRTMLENGQIEVMGGGFFEPVMSAIPLKDAVEQIEMMATAVKRIFGVTPLGAWTTERVWHRKLADLYQDAGIEYTILDDNHLRCCLDGERGLFGPCLTYGDSGSVTVFPASTKLRYLIPFRPVQRTIDLMKDPQVLKRGEVPCFFFADDLEKFGAWPYTNGHVYRKKWLENFLRALTDEKEWLETATYSEIGGLRAKHDVGVLQPSSYREMDEWSGGDFGNFLTKYPESGRMHERMLEVSDKVSVGTVSGNGSDEGHRGVKMELFKAQTSCPYWHGTFGGVYLPHLRSGVYAHIIRAEKMLENSRSAKRKTVSCVERSGEGCNGEFILANEHMKVYTSQARGAAIEEIDLKEREVNLINCFSRRREEYHLKLEKGYGAVVRKARKAALRGEEDDVNIHEVLGVAGRGLGKLLSYDGHRRCGFVTRLAGGHVKWDKFVNSPETGKGFFDGEYSLRTSARNDLITQTFSKRGILDGRLDIEVVKEITLGREQALTVSQRVKSFSREPAEVTCAVEFNFLVWDIDAMKKPRTFVSDRVRLEDRYTGMEVNLFTDRPVRLTQYPVYTINETERGLCRTFQGVCVAAGDHFGLNGREEGKIGITVHIR